MSEFAKIKERSRLRKMGRPIDWDTEIIYRGRPLSDYRAAIIEECARVVEACLKDGYRPGERIAAAIRALKDKP